MRRRSFLAALVLSVFGAFLSGCQTIREQMHPTYLKRDKDRDKDREASAETSEDGEDTVKSPVYDKSDASNMLDVSSEKPKPFFKSSRLSGAMSDEGRDIEKELGIQ